MRKDTYAACGQCMLPLTTIPHFPACRMIPLHSTLNFVNGKIQVEDNTGKLSCLQMPIEHVFIRGHLQNCMGLIVRRSWIQGPLKC